MIKEPILLIRYFDKSAEFGQFYSFPVYHPQSSDLVEVINTIIKTVELQRQREEQLMHNKSALVDRSKVLPKSAIDTETLYNKKGKIPRQ